MNVNRKGQRFIRRGHRELTVRSGRVNQSTDGLQFPGHVPRHQWGCPGCGARNDARHLSCRVCPTLYWGAAP